MFLVLSHFQSLFFRIFNHEYQASEYFRRVLDIHHEIFGLIKNDDLVNNREFNYRWLSRLRIATPAKVKKVDLNEVLRKEKVRMPKN